MLRGALAHFDLRFRKEIYIYMVGTMVHACILTSLEHLEPVLLHGVREPENHTFVRHGEAPNPPPNEQGSENT
jgi:hypothetical protein